MISVRNGNTTLQKFSMMAFYVLLSSVISTLCVKSNFLPLFCFLRWQLQFWIQKPINFFSDMKVRPVGRSGELAHACIMPASLTKQFWTFFLNIFWTQGGQDPCCVIVTVKHCTSNNVQHVLLDMKILMKSLIFRESHSVTTFKLSSCAPLKVMLGIRGKLHFLARWKICISVVLVA